MRLAFQLLAPSLRGLFLLFFWVEAKCGVARESNYGKMRI